jgi:hypothetical protein
MYWLCADLYHTNESFHNIYKFKDDIKINDKVKLLFDLSEKIIFPSKFVYQI